TGHSKGTVSVWDLSAGKLKWSRLLSPIINRLGAPGKAAFVTFTPDGQFVVAADERDAKLDSPRGVVNIYKAANGEKIREVLLRDVRHAALSPDGKTLVAASSDSISNSPLYYSTDTSTQLHGIDIESGKIRFQIPPHDPQRGQPLNGFHKP